MFENQAFKRHPWNFQVGLFKRNSLKDFNRNDERPRCDWTAGIVDFHSTRGEWGNPHGGLWLRNCILMAKQLAHMQNLWLPEFSFTLPETNSKFAPENGWLEYCFLPLGALRMAYFQGLSLAVSFREDRFIRGKWSPFFSGPHEFNSRSCPSHRPAVETSPPGFG